VNHLVLSMTTSAVPLRTRSACHQGPKSAKSLCYSVSCSASNLSNLDSFGILLTNPTLFHIVKKQAAGALERTATDAFLDPNKRINRLAHPPFERTPKQSHVPGTEAGSLDCALAEVGRKERKGLPGFFGFVGFGRLTLHREMPKMTAIACHMVVDACSCVSAPMRSIGRAVEAATSRQKTFTKTQSFAAQLIIRFWIALHGCISIPAIRQTLTLRKMLRVISRATTLEKIGNKPDE
jgi:hypothetical protein